MVHKLIIRYGDWTFDFIECDELQYPALREAIEKADKSSVVHMSPDSDYPWNEAYLAQPWRSK